MRGMSDESRERVNVVAESDPSEVTAALGTYADRRRVSRFRRSACLVVPRWAAVVAFVVLIASLIYAAVQS